ncbi:MAG: 50S ribosomal protein L30 [Deltaproteobacteria bacterium]|jgi:large subunit ribosomal protein L30|nr:50S ribosomal protein L30 [Deltaproteobacteria bacterium]
MSRSHLKVTLVRSPIGTPGTQRQTLVGLGLRRLGRSVVRPNTPAFRGMVKKVLHLVDVEELEWTGTDT